MGRGRERTKTYIGQLLQFELKGINTYLRNTGAQATCTWSNGSSMGLTITETGLTLSYAIQEAPYSQHVPITYTPCHYGKERPWMLCPRCNKRVGRLYLYRSYFCCRTCTGLKYQSQSLAPEDRGTNAIRNQQKKLDKAGGYEIYQTPDKPKGMHERKYEQIVEKLEQVRQKRDEALDARLVKMIHRLKGMEDLMLPAGLPEPKKQGRPPKPFWG